MTSAQFFLYKLASTQSTQKKMQRPNNKIGEIPFNSFPHSVATAPVTKFKQDTQCED